MGWIKDYLSFSKRERNATIAAVLLVTTFIWLPQLFPARKLPARVSAEAKDAVARQPANNRTTENPQDVAAVDEVVKEYTLFTFDPNSLDEAGWMKLGLAAKTARTILNYRSKGGRFRKPEDLRKIYSLKKEDADRLIPYIIIKDNTGPQYSSEERSYRGNFNKSVAAIDINTATVEDWKSLPAIGDVLSKRIVNYRERLGGFSSVEQVGKTYGLKDSTFQIILPYLKLSSPKQNKININLAFEQDLMQCKEMSIDVAKAIVIYRKQNGPYRTVSDIKKIVFITEEMFQKVSGCLVAE